MPRPRRSLIKRPCLRCGKPAAGSYCPRHAREVEASRQARQPYRAAYTSATYLENRRIRLQRSGGRCEAIGPDGLRCWAPAQETHHVIPLSSARTYAEALELCDWRNLRAVCWRHNPRGPVQGSEI